MTAEVIVMNRGGVALAADSAVTISVGQSSKVRDSALKVFMLSKCRPVGVMIYNNSSLLGIPMETLIKLFRQDLGRTGYAKLHEYGDALVEFLNRNNSMFPLSLQDKHFFAALQTEYERIADSVKKALVYDWSEEEPAEGIDKILREKIEERLEFWERQKNADYFGVNASDFVGRHSGGVLDVMNRTFLGWPDIRDEAHRAMYAIAKHLVAKDYFSLDVVTGLVIAGFGEEEHFPVVQHLRVGGIFDNQLKVRPGTVHEVSEDKPSEVLSFAYQDMVKGFLDGISPSVSKHLNDDAAVAFIQELQICALDAVDGLTPDVRKRAAEIVRRESTIKAAEFERIVLRRADKRRRQIQQAMEALSLKELAQVASTLVGLSSFEHQMSLDLETVGGPVDVAVISKGDGFIWIDRKHYFQPELNRHFFRNYFDDGMKGEDAIDNAVSDGDEKKEAPDG